MEGEGRHQSGEVVLTFCLLNGVLLFDKQKDPGLGR